MGTKMKKGILKPFRYISNMMDGKEAVDNGMQIGFPTDVKHVAHIGWDGPSAPNKDAGAAPPTWMKDYHSAPLDSASFRSETGGTAAAATNQWASQEIVIDGGGLGETSFRETGSTDVAAAAGGESPPSPNSRRSRRHRSRGSATSSMDCTGTEGAAPEKEKKSKKSSRGKNRKKDKSDKTAGDDTAAGSDLPAVPKKSNRRKNKGSSEGSSGAGSKDAAAAAAPEDAEAAAAAEPLLPPVTEEDKDNE